MPHDFAVSWSAAHKHFMRWANNGTWNRILDDLRASVRTEAGRDPQPSAGVIDSCSIKGTAVPGPRGFDGAKKVNGIKRHIVVDTLGPLVAVLVTADNIQDRAAAVDVLARARRRCPRPAHIRAHRGHTGKILAPALTVPPVTIEIVSGVKPKGGFIVQPRRWVVERTSSSMHPCRRLTRQYKQTALAHQAMTTIDHAPPPRRPPSPTAMRMFDRL